MKRYDRISPALGLRPTAFILVAAASLALAGCQGLTNFLGLTEDDPSDKVFSNYAAKIPNANLRASIAESVGKPFGEMTVGELEAVLWVDTKERLIPSLEGIQYCKGLKWLGAYNSGIADASALSMLTALEGCYMAENQIATLDPFLMSRGMKNLYLIRNPLDHDELRKITISNFPALEGLQVSGRDPEGTYSITVDQVKALIAPMTGLVSIGFDRFTMGDVGFESLYSAALQGKEGTLVDLWLVDDQLTDASLARIGGFTALKSLSLMENPGISGLSGLTGLTALKQVFLNNTSVTDLTPLKTIYDLGAFRDSGSHADFYGLDGPLELGTGSALGTANQAVIDYLLSRGVSMNH